MKRDTVRFLALVGDVCDTLLLAVNTPPLSVFILAALHTNSLLQTANIRSGPNS
jgi:hypothetical protein